MINLEPLWQYQQKEIELDIFETALKETPAFVAYSKTEKFMKQNQKKILLLTKSKEAQQQQIVEESQKLVVLKEHYQKIVEKFNDSDKKDLEEISKLKKHFELLNSQIFQEKRDFTLFVEKLEKEDVFLSTIKTKLLKAKKDYDIQKKEVEQEMANAQSELEKLRNKVNEEKNKIDPSLFQEYLLAKKSFKVPIAKVENNKCMGCNMELPAVVTRKLKEQNEIAECESCGRILYLCKAV